MPRRNDVVVVTGAASFLGSSILRALKGLTNKHRLIAVDRHRPAVLPGGIEYHAIDLVMPDADRQLAELLKGCECPTTIVHTALPNEHVRREQYGHRLMIVGTRAVLGAAKRAHVHKLILASTTDVYGAFATNPQYLSETHPLHGGSQSDYLKDRARVEELFRRMERTEPGRVVTILRPCTIVGPSVKNFETTFFRQPVIPTVLGFDPLVQFVHESDVLSAFITVIERDEPGTFNIVGDGVMPLSRAIHLARKPSVPLPECILSLAADIAWSLDIGFAPATHVPFLKYSCVADGEKSHRVLGFEPAYTSQEAFLNFVERGPKSARST